ncbi:SANT/Myb-like DNA-binding domain-containing protein [Bradyrhizobium liaoningense]|uniref:SANT/Myb-like DNA-binding domain-containing protein n=1 Tax=Bradyrhizobium liaoningense TaxID=43992 RepID=UPI001BAD6454|nr:SANT/Myb-like DNA-binding domain-containing protein [Bradyrhizobium liaoningense]MBR1033060.1 Myb-like DNA-binding domain-containing protein [Bradyrhizobium liaoningense]
MSWPVHTLRNLWTAAELDRLCVAVDGAGGDWARVAANMPGRTEAACKQAYNSHRRRERLAKAAPAAAAAPKRLKSWQDKRAKEKAAEQERARAFAHERSVTSAFFGDPLPGRSALDQRSLQTPPKRPTLYTGDAR